jgi:N-methylhydantoinase A
VEADARPGGRYAGAKTQQGEVSVEADARPGGRHAGIKIGIDVGGTFTDFVVAREGQPPQIHKTLSTPADPSLAVVDGLAQIAAAMDPPLALEEFTRSIDTIVHGTTVTTNATLTSNGAKCALLTTEGVRDALEMRRGIREEQYNNRYTNVKPIVPRARRAGIGGRVDRDGRELAPLDVAGVQEALAGWRAEGVQAVAVCFLNSFANPAHEQAAAALVKRALPEAYLSVSTEVLPSIRFYERVSTTVLNAYVGPKLEHYLEQLVDRLAGAGFAGLLLIMQSNGGVISPQAAREKAALTLLSGPAGGPGAGLFYAGAHGQDRCITTDMGGTSFEASVAVGAPMVKNDGEIARHRIALPMLDIHTIGAGGGSIGWLDEGGLLRMGPQSAGADPGPACYGRGGTLPTTTDANVVLGYLDPEFFAGGRMRLDMAGARRAIEHHIAKPMGLSVEQAAAGMYRVACNNMAQGVREVTIKRGFDPREFPLIPGGGAGPIHGCLICSELEIPLQIVPREASVLCAFGMLMCELRHDYVRTFVARLDALDWSRLGMLVETMSGEGSRALAEERIPPSRRRAELRLDCRYLRQYHEVSVPVPLEVVERRDAHAVARAFHDEHQRLYGYALEAEKSPIEIINVRLQAVGATERPAYRKEVPDGADASAALKGRRTVYVAERDAFAEVPVYDGHRMRCGHRIAGPALVEQQTTAIVVSDGFDCVVDALGSFVLYAKGREDMVRAAAQARSRQGSTLQKVPSPYSASEVLA